MIDGRQVLYLVHDDRQCEEEGSMTQLATHAVIVGRTVGDNRRHTAVLHVRQPGNAHGYVLAVRNDGQEYAVWTTLPGPDDTVLTRNGKYFPVLTGSSQDAFSAALKFFEEVSR